MSEEDKLKKACPFCGEMPIVHTREDGIISVECSTRHGCVNSAGWSTPEQWNKRPIEDQLRAENERLRAEILRLNNKPSRIEQISKDATKNHKKLMKYLLRIGRL